MATPFSRSLRSIEAEGRGLARWLAPLALLFLAAWGWWMARAEVPLYAASTSARLVRERAVHPLQSAVDGRVVALHAALEQPVEAGALLVELDSTAQALALAEERARLAAVEGELGAAGAAVAALEAAERESHAAVAAARREAELELEARRIALRYADEEAGRLTQLEETGDVSKISAARARADAEKARFAVASQEATLERIALDARRDDGDRAALLAERRRELAAKEGARGVHAAVCARLEREFDARNVRAPAAGTIAELARIRPGSFVRAGEALGAVVASGRLVVEAEFPPAEALGRVRLGQPAELALAGFPPAQFGALALAVERIASEARDGTIRVELALVEPPPGVHEAGRVPLEHGLPGAVRIEVERASPAALVLRAVGGAFGLTRPRASGNRAGGNRDD